MLDKRLIIIFDLNDLDPELVEAFLDAYIAWLENKRTRCEAEKYGRRTDRKRIYKNCK